MKDATKVVFTEKMDGENTTIYSGGCHARSPDSGYHASRDWMKAFAAGIAPQLGTQERIVGEYLFAQHSVGYSSLPSYFLGFAWILDGIVQSWPDTLGRFRELGIQPVPTLKQGQMTDKTVDQVVSSLDFDTQEGFVVRVLAAFPELEMATHIAKYVRAGHVQTETHWRNAAIVRNGLKA